MHKDLHRVTLLTIVALCFVACRPPLPPEEEQEPDPEAYVEESCEMFCARAVGCSEEFAESWEFTTVAECEDVCSGYATSFANLHERPECKFILGDMWQCAGMIDECADFQFFEDQAFGIPVVLDRENLCKDELQEVLELCN